MSIRVPMTYDELEQIIVILQSQKRITGFKRKQRDESFQPLIDKLARYAAKIRFPSGSNA